MVKSLPLVGIVRPEFHQLPPSRAVKTSRTATGGRNDFTRSQLRAWRHPWVKDLITDDFATVDFDWLGMQAQLDIRPKQPSSISLIWNEGVCRRDLITKDHGDHRFEVLTGPPFWPDLIPCQPVAACPSEATLPEPIPTRSQILSLITLNPHILRLAPGSLKITDGGRDSLTLRVPPRHPP